MLTFGWAILNRWLKSLKLTVFQFFLLFCCQASFAVSQQPIYNTTTAFFRQLFLQSFFDFFVACIFCLLLRYVVFFQGLARKIVQIEKQVKIYFVFIFYIYNFTR